MKVNRNKLIIAILLLILLIIFGIGLWFYGASKRGAGTTSIADMEDFIQDSGQTMVADTMEKPPQPSSEITPQKASAEMEVPETAPQVSESRQTSNAKEAENQPVGEQQTIQKTEPEAEKVDTVNTSESASSPEVNVNVEEIQIPDINTELGGGGISISGTIALEQAYYEEHNLQKARKLARDILKSNPSDPTAKKILQLIELESKGNQALKAGDFQSAIMYFQKMQEMDPNNIWAKKGIIRAQSGG